MSDDFSVALQNLAVFDGKFEIYVEFGVRTAAEGMLKVEFLLI